MLYKGFDASSNIPPAAPAGCRWVLGYIGGHQATHVWRLAEWLRFAQLHQFPAWVADLNSDPVVEAREACATAKRIGWRDDGTRALICDTETSVNRGWYQSWKAEVGRLGYLEANYGSLGAPGHPLVEANGSQRIIAAKWDGDPVLEGGQHVEGHQYAADVEVPGGIVDLSVMDHALWILGGRGPRRAEA